MASRNEIDYEDIKTWTEKFHSNHTYKQYHDVEFPAEFFDEEDILPIGFPEDWLTEDMYKPTYVNLTRDDESHKVSRKRSAMARKHEYDPNVPKLDKKGVLTWGAVRVNMIGTDNEGNQILSIRKGAGEPIYMRFSLTQSEIRKGGKKAQWK